MKAPRPASTKTKWRNRPAFCLNNGVVQLTTLTGGGHIADFRLLDPTSSSVNALWEAPWPTMDPDKFQSGDLANMFASTVRHLWASFSRPSQDMRFVWTILEDRPKPRLHRD